MLLLIVFLFTLISLLSFFSTTPIFNNKIYRTIVYLSLLVTIGLLFANRPNEAFSDTLTYIDFFNDYRNLSLIEAIYSSPMETGFTILQWIISQVTWNSTIYFFILFIIFFIILKISFKKVFKNDYLFALLAFMCTPMFVSMSGNILRTGLAFSFFLLGLAYILKNKKFFSIPWLLLSVLFHTTFLPFVLVIVFFKINRFSFRIFYLALFITSLIFLSNLQTTIFPFISKFDKVGVYTSQTAFEQYGNNGLRYDFFLFNIFLILFLIIINKYGLRFKDEFVNYFLKLTIFSDVIFHLLGFIAYSDRLAIYVWLFFSITLIVMVLKLSQKYPVILPVYLLTCIMLSIITKSYLYFH
ncbi:EpsG family protein [Paenisporosarcina quisquiliarum]|nr:EpsG family protein [Paenisporosarcina quisquiliarum]